ncbi:MAG: hypothetical protein H7210_03285 [Pyrinomonadaceae bacterium]|nr:hypothetical protein [Phycisphaerales bacterium]
MRLSDAALYLVGSRSAILRIAGSRWSLVIGILLVLSASLARNYDGAYLAEEWTVLLHGVTVSVANAFILYALMYVLVRIRKGVAPPFFAGYLSFLGLFWMTSPMAWVYAVPYERWLEPVDAIRANLNTLAFISIWRVALMTRVLSVIFNARWWPTLFFVLLFSDVAVIIGATMMPAPLIDIMGGLQHTPQDQLLSNANMLTKIYGMLSLPVWLIGSAIGLAHLRGAWQVESPRWGQPPRSMLAAAVICLLGWIGPLMYAQPEQRNRSNVERLLRSGHVPEGPRMMSSISREAFPPIWDPPPRIGYGEQSPTLETVAAAIMAEPQAPWVVSLFLDKSKQRFIHRGEINWDYYANGVINQLINSEFNVIEPVRLRMHLKFDASLRPEDRAHIERTIEFLEQKAREDATQGPN